MPDNIPQWSRFEVELTSPRSYDNPLQDVLLTATFVSDSGLVRRVDGFWDGGSQWRVRFTPPVQGNWRYTTECSDPSNTGLHGRSGAFRCVEPNAGNVFRQHGTVRVVPNGFHLGHEDGTPFFWMADTAWNGPLLSGDDEWLNYLDTRSRQGFTAVQWVTTQWIAAPHGDREGRLPFSGRERITVNPAVFQRLDRKLEQMNDAGLLGAPVLLWAAEWGDPDVMSINPGLTLPEDQAVLLARYMVARWDAFAVVWILAGDGEYRGAKAARWRRIGRAVFGGRNHSPVMMHPNGMSWHADEFRDESWLDLWGYQGCHFGDENAHTWAVYGPPASEWHLAPRRPILNLEPPYENHVQMSNPARRFDADEVRRALYWSLLVSPTAGVSYGGHGVWGWDDGTCPPTAHEASGIPLPWEQALWMPAAEQVSYLVRLFQSIRWWTLRPDSSLVVHQPGETDITRFVAASRSETGDLALFYIPQDRSIELNLAPLRRELRPQWMNPGTGERFAAEANANNGYETPSAGDWLLLFS